MKRSTGLLSFLILVILVVSACEVPLTVPTSLPAVVDTSEATQEDTPIPPEQPADDWAAVQANGKLRVGTAADYAPYSYYNSQFQVDGFDVALIRELGRRLGVEVEVTDYAFDGLFGAVYLNQIDAAIAAISVSEERSSWVDFSDYYYMGADAILARADFAGTLANPVDMVGYRIAAQKGTAYEGWVRTNLLNTGLIKLDDFFVYDKPENAVRDLLDSRVDVVYLDRMPALEFAKDTKLKVVAEDLTPQSFAIASRNDSTLVAELNRVLAEVKADGTLDNLVKTYLHSPVVEEPEAVEPTPTPIPTAVIQPTPTVPPCVYGLAYVADLSYDDYNMTNLPKLQPGQYFTKGWRVRNTGTCKWDPNFIFAYKYGNVPAAQMSANGIAISQVVLPGAEIDLYVNLIAPYAPGTYQGFWGIQDTTGSAFGTVLWVGISVPGAEPTPLPSKPYIASFNAAPNMIAQGQCANIGWTVTGQVTEVEIKRDNNIVWGNAPFSGVMEQCLDSAGTVTYKITAVGPGGSVTNSIQVVVYKPVPNAPTIDEFVGPREIVYGNCARLIYETTGAQVVQLYMGRELLHEQLPGDGEVEVCPVQTGMVEYRLRARNEGGYTDQTYPLSVLATRER